MADLTYSIPTYRRAARRVKYIIKCQSGEMLMRPDKIKVSGRNIKKSCMKKKVNHLR